MEDGVDEVSGFSGTLTFAGKTANVAAKASTGARIIITAHDGALDDDPAPKVRGCSGGACEISFDPTGDDESPGETTVTIRVVAANGYNDHEYTVAGITRTDPMDNTPESVSVGTATVTFNDNNVASADITATATTAAVAVDLDDDEGLQTVKASSGSDGLTGVAGATDKSIITFTVATAVGQTTVTITVTSEDGVDNVMTLNIVRPSS